MGMKQFQIRVLGTTMLASLTWNSVGDLVQFVPVAAPLPPVELTPSAQWNGTAGSGFGTANPAAPTDPARTTGKPAGFLIDPLRQRFADELTISVMAEALNGNTMIGGVDRVRYHLEGASVDVTSQSLRAFPRRNGGSYLACVYSVTLKKPVAVSGIGNLYVEIIPADPTLQNRVLGPFTFSMQATKHDRTITIDPMAAVVTGVSYQDINTAANYCRTQGFANPLLQVVRAGDYAVATWNGYRPANYITIEGMVPGVRIVGAAGWTYQPGNISSFTNEVWWRNITFDFQNAASYAGSGSNTLDPVFENCTLQNTAGREQLYAGTASRPVGFTVSANPYFIGCHFSDLHNAIANASHAIATTSSRTTSDFATGCRFWVGHIGDDHDASHARQDFPAISLQYTGAEATATIAIPGNPDANNRTVTVIIGGTSYTFALRNTLADFNAASAGGFDPVAAGYGYFNRHVVTWLNTLPNVTATLTDDTHRATSLSRAGLAGAGFTAVSIKTPQALVNCFDFHSDVYQQVGTLENVLLRDVRMTGVGGVNLFLGGGGASQLRDAMFVNFFVTNIHRQTLYDDWTISNSTIGLTTSHVGIAHMLMPNQRMTLPGATGTTWNPSRTVISNNAVYRFDGGTGTQAPLVVTINNNQVWGISPDHGLATNMVKAGDKDSWFTGFDAGDYTLAGPLLSNLKAPIVARDLGGVARPSPAPVGALVS